MQDTRPLLLVSDFPAIVRDAIDTLQVNLGYRCNQSCTHCHVNAGPTRSEMMQRDTVDELLALLRLRNIRTLDLTGGAPELNPHFRYLVESAVASGVSVIDRCNLTILLEPGQEDLAEFLAMNRVVVTASLPCYLEDNVDSQRGKGVFDSSIRGLQKLNELGYGKGGELRLNLVYNPLGASLPPPQEALEQDYKRELGRRFDIAFDKLLTLTNLPISRFGAVLLAQNQFHAYMELLRNSFRENNLESVMCRRLVSVNWRGFVFDCDFNQMLDLPMLRDQVPVHVRDLLQDGWPDVSIRTGGHCYGCTAGQGSSCGGALAVA